MLSAMRAPAPARPNMLCAARISSSCRPRAFRSRGFGPRTAAGFDLLSSLGLGGSATKAGLSRATMGGGCELAPKEAPAGKELATFAGGCFWGTELKFMREIGVEKTSSGYTQGTVPNPTYEAVCSGNTGHTEAIQVVYDPTKTTYRRLLEAFAEQTDLTTMNRQGSDRGTQYRSGIYYHTPEQKAEAEKFVAELNEELARENKRGWAGREVMSEVKPAGDYYIAEAYHQQYLAKGGRFGAPQSAEKGATDKIRCYG